jgi:hypothetical protein
LEQALVALLITVGGAISAGGADFSSVASGAYSANATWTNLTTGLPSNPSGLLPDTATITSHRVTISTSNAVNDTIAILPSGILAMSGASVDFPFAGATLRLQGGTLECLSGGALRRVNGTVILEGNSTLVVSNTSVSGATVRNFLFDELRIGSGGSSLLVTNGQTAATGIANAIFPVAQVRNSGTLRIGGHAAVTVSNAVVFRPGATLWLTGDKTFLLTNTATVGLRLTGSAELLGSTNFTLVNRLGGTFTDNATFDTSGGLWSKAGTAGTTLEANLSNRKGGLTVGGSLSFAPEDAGYVDIYGLTSGEVYQVILDLANVGGGGLGGVINELSLNTMFSSFATNDLATQSIQFLFTAPASGTMFFAWDNINSLGADVEGITVVPEPSALVLMAAGLGLLVISFRRGRAYTEWKLLLHNNRTPGRIDP